LLATASAVTGFCLLGASDPLTDLKAGSTAIEGKRYAAAVTLLEPLIKKLPKLADYSGWFLANAQFSLRNYAGVQTALEAVWKQTPPSPFTARSYILSAQALVLSGSAAQAVDILRKNYAALPQPQGDLVLADAFNASGDLVSSAIYNQRVYYNFPLSPEAARAEGEIARLKTELGSNYPPSMPNAMLARALKLLDSNQTARARKELEALIPQLGGAERDLARVRVGVADYKAKDNTGARRYLNNLEITSPDADAERLFYLLELARRLNNKEEVVNTLDRLGRLYPNSNWRLQALISAGNEYLIGNQIDAYEPIYRACYESFPKDSQAALCHWKVVWGHYLRRNPDAADLLRAHLRLFPGGESASAALYFLGRLAEDNHDSGSARAFYDEVAREYPNQYYATVARERQAQLGATVPAPSASAFLRTITFPERSRVKSFQATGTAAARIERAHLLDSAGLLDLAEAELRFAARTEDQPYLMAMELASLSSRTLPDQALRYIKAYAGAYLFLPLDSAPRQFWTLAFPLPYRSDLERYSKENGLDPYLIAALIRQESEFDPKAVSPANARGLTQIEPPTGRELSRRLKVPAYTTAKLFQPQVNLQLGTYYFKSLSASLSGKPEVALAAYNAGLSRARAWLTWGEFREPAEFIETVPFSQTRGYIQAVLRNADVYRRLYAPVERASSEKPSEK
jgi:peptidoglycan lytic transglycosylase